MEKGTLVSCQKIFDLDLDSVFILTDDFTKDFGKMVYETIMVESFFRMEMCMNDKL